MPAAKKAAATPSASTKIADKTKTLPRTFIAEPFAIAATVKARRQRSKLRPPIHPYRADWRDPLAYPPPECTDMEWLAWEFLRRNKKYAEHVYQMLALPQGEFITGLTAKGNACLDGMVCTPPAEPGETVKRYRRRVDTESGGKIKPRIEKPQSTFINLWMLEQPVPVEHPYDLDEVQFVPSVVKMYRNRELTGRRVRLMMYHNEMAVRFRLDLNLKIQFTRAKKMLEKAAKQFKKQAEKEDETKGDAPEASNVNGRNGRKISGAHFWLRTYDALNESKNLLDDTDLKHKRTLISGPSEITKTFKNEGVKTTLNRSGVDTFNKAAKRMIDNNGYQKLVIIFEAAPTKTIDQEMSRMAAKSSSRKG